LACFGETLPSGAVPGVNFQLSHYRTDAVLACDRAFRHSSAMCGRFNVIDSPGLRELLQDLGIEAAPQWGVNIAPTEDVALVAEEADGRVMRSVRWWLTPSWAPAVDQKYAMFNARCENLAKSPAFRQPFRCQRGLVPMSSFLEWRTEEGSKQPWLVTNARAAMAAAALWDVWSKGDHPLVSCTLVTAAAAPEFEPWHRRMPVLLGPDEWDRWLDNTRPVAPDDAIFRSDLKEPLRLLPLSRAVGDSRRKEPALLEPVGETVKLGC